MRADERQAMRELYGQDSNLHDMHEQHAEQFRSPPSSEPDSSDYGSGHSGRDESVPDGLPPELELDDAGLRHVEMNDADGIANTFGQELSTDDLRKMLSLDHLKDYADQSGSTLKSTLTVNTRGVDFQAEAGDFDIHVSFTPSNEGVQVNYHLMVVPGSLQGNGKAREMISDMVSVHERLGTKSVRVDGASWVGKYLWPALGFRPSAEAEAIAIKEFGEDLTGMMGGEAAAPVLARLKTLRDVADARVPLEAVRPVLPALEEAYERFCHGAHIENIGFENALIKPGKDGQYFHAGKAFMLIKSGPWNSDLKLAVAAGTPWYDQFKLRLGMAGVALGIGTHELLQGFSSGPISLDGAGENQPDKVVARAKQAMAEEEQNDRTEAMRTKLGYLATESRTSVATTARALASPGQNKRTVERIPGVTNSSGVASFLGSHENLRDAYEQRRDTLKALAKDPMALVDDLTEGLGAMQETAPGLHAKVVSQTYKVASFLQSKIPGTIGASLSRPEGTPPNPLAIKQFALYYSAATEPATVLTDLTNNRARKEQVDTLKELWPEAYDELKLSVVKQMSQGRPTVAQRIRLDLLFDFGDGLDAGLSNRLAAMAQQPDKGAPGGAGGPEKPKSAPGKMTTRKSQPSIGGASPFAGLNQGAAKALPA
jgi:hypothetical protein